MKKLLTLGLMGLFSLLADSAFAQSNPNNALGDNQVEVEPGVFAIYTGDINQDGNIDIFDSPLLDTDIASFSFGYLVTDLNGDGNVDIFDSPILDENISKFIYAVTP
jgi:hypothetical protein